MRYLFAISMTILMLFAHCGQTGMMLAMQANIILVEIIEEEESGKEEMDPYEFHTGHFITYGLGAKAPDFREISIALSTAGSAYRVEIPPELS